MLWCMEVLTENKIQDIDEVSNKRWFTEKNIWSYCEQMEQNYKLLR